MSTGDAQRSHARVREPGTLLSVNVSWVGRNTRGFNVRISIYGESYQIFEFFGPKCKDRTVAKAKSYLFSRGMLREDVEPLLAGTGFNAPVRDIVLLPVTEVGS